MRLPAGFAGLEQSVWPPTRGRIRPSALERPVDSLQGVGPALTRKLAKLGIERVDDLLEHRPLRYQAAAPERRIVELFGEEEAVIAGEIRSSRLQRARRLQLVKARVADTSGEITAVWFNQGWLAERLRPGMHVRLRGSLRGSEFAVRDYDLDGGSATEDFAPVYPASEDVSPKRLRGLVQVVLPLAARVPDPVPAELKQRLALPQIGDALTVVHRPRSREEAETGRRRRAFDELLRLQLGLALARRKREHTVAPALGEPGDLIRRYRDALPFTLTEHQEHAIAEIDRDLVGTVPMQRLLQGDVGSGKTVVALYALLRAVEAGKQGALMAPTETLAEQHFLTVEPICSELGVRVALLTGSVKTGISDAQVVVGTHALIQEGVDFAELAVAVVDEQHRFGVEQRRALAKPTRTAGKDGTRAEPASLSGGTASGAAGVEQRKAIAEGRSPHVLHMTATPIPRTLALTVYGDLAVSEIAKPPASRRPVVTRWIPQERSSEAYMRLRRLLEEGRQAYVVCPVIEESETRQARAAEAEAERLGRAELEGFRIGCLHGRLRPADRRELMARFKAGELDVLVATTVIEVGVDVANATVMIVQEADRFGLAQLHQLRGRVGRGAEQSYCLLVSRAKDELTDSARARLEAMVETTDGFALAERDLEIRGEGELLGTRQSGAFGLVWASLRGDRDLLELARREAEALVDVDGPLRDQAAAASLAEGG
jgi:ATP-dependent DNA helicase RecG